MELLKEVFGSVEEISPFVFALRTIVVGILLYLEESMAKKYAQLSQQITDPKLQQMLKGLEQGARNHYSTLTQVMPKFNIV